MPLSSRRGPWKPVPTTWTPQRTTSVAGRLSRAYEATPPHLLEAGAAFYPTWNETADHVGQHLGKSVEHGAAVLAHLSPANEAEVNRIQGLQMVHGVSDKGLGHLVRAGEHATMAKSTEVRLRHMQPGTRAHTALSDDHAAHTAEIERLRRVAGVRGTPLGSLGSRELGNAARVIMGHHDDDPLGSLGSMKIRDFGGDIADPNSHRVPIDTHYHDAAEGRIDIPYKANRGLLAVGRYEGYQGASVQAWQNTAPDIRHSAFMGGIWYGHQQRKVDANPNALKSRRASDSKIAGIRANPAFAHFMPEAHGLSPAFGKIGT